MVSVPVEMIAAPTDAWYQRDASFFSHPDTYKPKRVHLMHPTKTAKHGQPMSVCGLVPLIEDFGLFPNPPQTMKCKRCLGAVPMSETNEVKPDGV